MLPPVWHQLFKKLVPLSLCLLITEPYTLFSSYGSLTSGMKIQRPKPLGDATTYPSYGYLLCLRCGKTKSVYDEKWIIQMNCNTRLYLLSVTYYNIIIL